jgi:hypothetical protein
MMTNPEEYFERYTRFLSASRQASQCAHQAAMLALKDLNMDFEHDAFVEKSEKSHQAKKVKKVDVEFEITNEMLAFYQESFKFKQEKGNYFKMNFMMGGKINVLLIEKEDTKKFKQSVEDNNLGDMCLNREEKGKI